MSHKNGTPMQKQIRLNQVFTYGKQSQTEVVCEDTGNNMQSTTEITRINMTDH